MSLITISRLTAAAAVVATISLTACSQGSDGTASRNPSVSPSVQPNASASATPTASPPSGAGTSAPSQPGKPDSGSYRLPQTGPPARTEPPVFCRANPPSAWGTLGVMRLGPATCTKPVDENDTIKVPGQGAPCMLVVELKLEQTPKPSRDITAACSILPAGREADSSNPRGPQPM